MPEDAPDFEQPIAFASQQVPATNAREAASQEGQAVLAEIETQVPANDEVIVPDAQQPVDLPAVLEAYSMYSIEPHRDATYVELQIDADGDGTVDTTPVMTPRIGSESFDPGALVPLTATVDVRLVNNSPDATTIGTQVLLREL